MQVKQARDQLGAAELGDDMLQQVRIKENRESHSAGHCSRQQKRYSGLGTTHYCKVSSSLTAGVLQVAVLCGFTKSRAVHLAQSTPFRGSTRLLPLCRPLAATVRPHLQSREDEVQQLQGGEEEVVQEGEEVMHLGEGEAAGGRQTDRETGRRRVRRSPGNV